MGRKQNIKLHSDRSERDRESFFAEVYQLHFKKLYAYAKAITRSGTLAQDVVSDVFYQLWKNNADLHEIRDIEVYLIVAVRNKSRRVLATNGMESASEMDEVIIEAIDYIDPQEVLLEKELLKVLDKVINDLAPQCRLIFKMAREQGLKNDEIATELGISAVTVKSQLRKAQLKLKKAIRSYNQSGESRFLKDQFNLQPLISMFF